MTDKVGKLLLQWRIKKVLPYIHGKFLDIGCGTNKLVEAYRAQGGQGIGLDVYDWDGVDIVVEDSTTTPYQNGEFETVSIIASLNHIPKREAVLREAHRILKKDGTIIVTMIPPFIGKWWHKIREPWDPDQHERGMHHDEEYGLTSQVVEELLEQAGFVFTTREHFMLGVNTITIAKKK